MFIHVRLIFPGVAGRTVPAYASRPGIFLPAAHLKISRCFMNFSLDNSTAFAIIINAVVAAEQMQWYRSGHNEHDWKSCCRQKRHEGSNPSHCAMKSSRKAWLSGSFLSSIGAAALSGPEVGGNGSPRRFAPRNDGSRGFPKGRGGPKAHYKKSHLRGPGYPGPLRCLKEER